MRLSVGARGHAHRRVDTAPGTVHLEAFFISTGLVAIAEIGDKTQLLAIMLAARFRRPWPILAGILAATVLNHALAAALGMALSAWLSGPVFQTVVGVAFLAMAAWALIPDKADDDAKITRGGVFLATAVAFFLVEIGDKTQVATSLLAARFQDIVLVTAGTTAGMMLANAPAVFFGEAVTRLIPLRYVRWAAAVLFALLGSFVVLAVLFAPR
jgi:putative Ca2+/H+ antiporter (TMEM165/GDT1 family)